MSRFALVFSKGVGKEMPLVHTYKLLLVLGGGGGGGEVCGGCVSGVVKEGQGGQLSPHLYTSDTTDRCEIAIFLKRWLLQCKAYLTYSNRAYWLV